jgi:hypothetical protein
VHLASAQARLEAMAHAAFERAVVDADLGVAARTRRRIFAGERDLGLGIAFRGQGHLVRQPLGLTAHVDENQLRAHVASEFDATLRDARERRDRAAEGRVDLQPERTQTPFVHDRARPPFARKEGGYPLERRDGRR